MDMPEFVPGLPGEWEAFLSTHRKFLEQVEVLYDAGNACFADPPPIDSTAAFVCWCLVRQTAQDFNELLLLSANGYGLAAQRVLRTMYERTVVARWLAAHPDETQRFLEWEMVQRAREAQAFVDGFGDALSEDRQAKFREVVEEATPYREQFLVPDCKKCGSRRLNHTWSRVDLVTMAKQCPPLGDWLAPAYYEPLNQIHATPSSLRKVFAMANGSPTMQFIHRDEAHQSLMLGHFLFLVGLELLADRTKDGASSEAVTKALESYKDVWNEGASSENGGCPVRC